MDGRGLLYPFGSGVRSTARLNQRHIRMNARTFPILAFVAVTFALAGCAKETQELAQEVGLLPSTCGSDGARLQATVDGSSYCANAQVIATGGDGSAFVTGFDYTGSSIILQFDTLGVGTHAITEAANAVVYMQAGASFVVGPDQTGTLTITEHNSDTRRLKATFQTTLLNALNGQTKTVQGNVDVIYTEGQ